MTSKKNKTRSIVPLILFLLILFLLTACGGKIAHKQTTQEAEVTPVSLSTPLSPHEYALLSTERRYKLFHQASESLVQGKSVQDLRFWPDLNEKLKIAKNVSLNYWGRSNTYDELAKNQILPEKILKALDIPHESVTQNEKTIQNASAGIMHSYGYLFSTLVTPYGLKSKRWLESQIDEKLGLPGGVLSPFPRSGEFLSNLTYTLEALTHGHRSCKKIKNVSPELCALKKNQFKTQALGFVELKLIVKNTKIPLFVRTYFIPFVPSASKGGDAYLLAYELQQGKDRKWITAFPVTEAFYQQAILPSDQPFKLRYNAYLDPSLVLIEIQKGKWVPLSK